MPARGGSAQACLAPPCRCRRLLPPPWAPPGATSLSVMDVWLRPPAQEDRVLGVERTGAQAAPGDGPRGVLQRRMPSVRSPGCAARTSPAQPRSCNAVQGAPGHLSRHPSRHPSGHPSGHPSSTHQPYRVCRVLTVGFQHPSANQKTFRAGRGARGFQTPRRSTQALS